MLKYLIVATTIFTLGVGGQLAQAKEEGTSSPAGWLKGEKTGWDGKTLPPGLSERDSKRAEKEARKKTKEAELEAKKLEKEAQKKAKKKKLGL